MKHTSQIIPTREQKKVLNEFIRFFLPARGTKRKNNGNELSYITDSLDRIFDTYFGFRLDRRAVLDTFEELGYSIYYIKGIHDGINFRPSPSGTGILYKDVYFENEAMYIYVDVYSYRVTELRLTAFSYQDNTSPDKIKNTESIKSEIVAFAKKHKI